MDKITRVGVDLAKNIMQIHAVDGAGHVVVRKAIARERFMSWFANLEPCLVAMEACSAAHYWARKLRALGHDVRLIPPQFVAPYRKGGVHVKNDALDAEATCEAASRPHMRFVPVKSAAQQSVLVLHRMRTGFVEERTALVNRLRGLLVEFGVFLPQGINQLRKHFVERIEDGNNELAGPARQALMRGWAQWQSLDDEIAWFDRQIAEHASHDPQARRCMDVCGVGRLTASAAVATIVDAQQFKNGRQMAAWLGIVPRQKSSGGKQRLGRITKQGSDYLRTLLFQGARSAVLTAHHRQDRLSCWIVQLRARVGYSKTLVAVANKHARILWAVLAKGERFDPSHAPARTGGAAGA
ncbi:transposase [Paraburkholderia sp. BL23I1N1]|uniref:IS110 family transposase n=1 Tax=unclassified Paraburkholderia TaxID=2615204 RepID=UPI000E268689|nr:MULTISPECIES: IS110 family transposase [unclassified Paraburkholderia]REE18494.1 transposase [Paraburkholderia sp. BL27I4N3]RKE35509.1 transposase [Paraburkholderia sp. BL23I1N1]